MDARQTHTPGPWNDGIYHATRSGGRTFAHIRAYGIVPIAAVPLDADGYGRAEGEANARLIAAAPDMLAALRKADQFITNGIELGYIRMPDASTPDAAHETPSIIRAALKATGG